MDLHISPAKLSGTIAVPGSKSHTIRGVVAALAADGVSTLLAPLESADTASALAAAEALGAKVLQKSAAAWVIQGAGNAIAAPSAPIDLGNSGTGLRLLAAQAARCADAVAFDGDASLRTRPMKPLLDALELLGVKCRSTDGHAPLELTGPLRGGATKVGGASSQYLSALLFALPMAERDSRITLDFLNEKPYVEITLKWLDFLGIRYTASQDRLHYTIPGGQKIAPFSRAIPADFSTAAFPLGAGMIASGEIAIRNLDFGDAQGDKKVFEFARQMGAQWRQNASGDVVVSGGAPLHGGVFDLNSTPDALPLLAAVAASLPGETTTLGNVPQARIKETDRIACMTRELRKMGADIEELPDGMVIRGTRLRGAELESYADHRIAMALAVAAFAAASSSVIHGAECACVTYPGFVADFRKLAGNAAVTTVN